MAKFEQGNKFSKGRPVGATDKSLLDVAVNIVDDAAKTICQRAILLKQHGALKHFGLKASMITERDQYRALQYLTKGDGE